MWICVAFFWSECCADNGYCCCVQYIKPTTYSLLLNIDISEEWKKTSKLLKFHSDLSQLYFLWIWPERNVKVLVLDFRVLILFWIYLNLSLKVELLVCSRTTCSKKLRGLATRSFAAYLSFNQKLPRCHFPNIEIAPFLAFLFGSIRI